MSLKHVLTASDIQIVYSHVILAEINQIPIDKYKIEHIELLEELNAKYIEPKSKKLSNDKPNQVWTNYIENLNSENDILGLNNIALSIDNFSRKASGLPIKNSFEEIGESLENYLENLTKIIIDSLNIDFNEDDLKEPFKSNAKQMKKDLSEILNKRQLITNEFNRLDNLPLGPKPFREYKPIKDLKISELASSEVVLAIENVFNEENPTSNWRNNSNDTLEDKIAIAYSLMNWAGYYPDDFDKIKKDKDRFRASNNDMQHAVMASKTTFLISNDYPFRMKTIASYEYAGSPTIVCSPQSFLEEHCDFRDLSSK